MSSSAIVNRRGVHPLLFTLSQFFNHKLRMVTSNLTQPPVSNTGVNMTTPQSLQNKLFLGLDWITATFPLEFLSAVRSGLESTFNDAFVFADHATRWYNSLEVSTLKIRIESQHRVEANKDSACVSIPGSALDTLSPVSSSSKRVQSFSPLD